MASPKNLTRSVGNSSVSPRSLVRSKWTSFCVGPWGKCSVADPSWEWGHPAECIKALSGHILLTHFLLDFCCWGWRWNLLKEQCNCSSVWCGHGGLEDGEVHLWGPLVEPGEVPYLVVDAPVTGSCAVALCCYCICYRAMSSLSGGHLSVTWQPPFSCSLLRVT